jgi:hypothetical protein
MRKYAKVIFRKEREETFWVNMNITIKPRPSFIPFLVKYLVLFVTCSGCLHTSVDQNKKRPKNSSKNSKLLKNLIITKALKIVKKLAKFQISNILNIWTISIIWKKLNIITGLGNTRSLNNVTTRKGTTLECRLT